MEKVGIDIEYMALLFIYKTRQLFTKQITYINGRMTINMKLQIYRIMLHSYTIIITQQNVNLSLPSRYIPN